MAAQWYTIFSKPRKEIQVANYLIAQELEVYCPTLDVNPVNRRAAKIRPYFPRYLFVLADIQTIGTGALQWIPGAVGLVAFDGEPVTVPDPYIAELKRRLAEIEGSGGLHAARFKRGDAVRITEGPFAGFDAIFDTQLDDNSRIQVLLHWLGREIRTKLDSQAVVNRKTH